jgi:hypothetical protein
MIIDASGRPISGASASLTPTAESDCEERPDRTTSNASGEFFLQIIFSPYLKKAEFQLEVNKAGYKAYTRKIGHKETSIYNMIITLNKDDDPHH